MSSVRAAGLCGYLGHQVQAILLRLAPLFSSDNHTAQSQAEGGTGVLCMLGEHSTERPQELLGLHSGLDWPGGEDVPSPP